MQDVVHVSLNKLPSSIKTTRFYNILNDKYTKKGRDVKIPLPSNVYAKELILSTVYDMIPTVDALYQLTGEIDEKNYEFIHMNKETVWPRIEYLKTLYSGNSFLNECVLLLGSTSPSLLLFETIENDYDNLLKYCVSRDLIHIDYKNICVTLARKGKYKCLKYMHSIGATINKDVLDAAIKHKSEDCVDYIIFYANVE